MDGWMDGWLVISVSCPDYESEEIRRLSGLWQLVKLRPLNNSDVKHKKKRAHFCNINN